jgi:uncharacterized protein YbjT (DUF2867 family)
MRVLILGGYGLIGSYVTARLLAAGHEVVGLARDMRETRRFARVRWVEGDLARMTKPEDWAPLLDGVTAVVNCAGALQDNPRDSLGGVHVTGPRVLYVACAARGVRRIVHISAAGIHAAPTAYAETKREGERALDESGLDWVVLRIGLVLAPGVYGGSALLRGLAGFPLVAPMAKPDTVMQVVSVHDVAEAVLRALAPDAPRQVTWDVLSPEKTTLQDIVTGTRAWLGFARAPVVRIPMPLVRLTAWCADAVAWLGWRSPLRTTSVKQLAAGVTGDPTPWIAATGITPRTLSGIFAQSPSTVQDRWFARLYFLKPSGILVIAAFWVFSGVVALGPGFDSGRAFLESGGVPAGAAWWTTTLGGWLDIVLGAAALFRRLMRPALIAMIGACVVYLAAGSFLHPEVWLQPLGVLAKVLPIMLAMALLAAIADER